MTELSGTFVTAAALIVWLGLACLSAGHAIMYKRDPRGATIWVLVSFAIPCLGPWFYLTFGINRIQRIAIRQLGQRDRPFDAPSEHVQPPENDAELNRAVAHLIRLKIVADHVTRLPMLKGNHVAPLHNGENAYPQMLEAIQSAEHSITLASYIFDWDPIGRAFIQALADASRRGIEVRVLVDGLGALGSASRIGRLLLKSGARVAAFYPPRFPLGRVRLNLRNHRKILVADGRIGFTGGMNISQRHLADRENESRVEDLHFMITGPVVSEMQHAFAEDWAHATGETLHGDAFFPRLEPTGSAIGRGISSGPDENFEIISWIFQAALAAARDRVLIATPYFVPPATLIASMALAAMRGVKIDLLLPEYVDRPFMRWVADAYLWQLLQHGIRVYRKPPPFAHTKLMIVDDRWVLLGSANLDPRSLRLNFEFNVETYDIPLAREMTRWLDGVIRTSHEVSLGEMDARPKWRRFRDGLIKLGSPFL